MRREGRQHGMVRTYPILPSPWNPKSEPRYNNKSNSPPTAGLFTKVSTKPSNHSKFTGKCGRPRCTSCHIHPAVKSKDKTKGTQKLKGCGDVVSLVTWRVVDARPGLNFSGFSATGILDHLDSDYSYYMDYDDHEIYYDAADDGYGDEELVVDSDCSPANGVEIEEIEDNDEENMSFCEVGFVWENVEEDEDWCVVEGI